MIVSMEKKPASTSGERAQELFKKTLDLESKRQKSLQARIPSDPNAWYQIRENYEAIILEDHAFSEQQNIEFALWQLHYKRIEEFRAHFTAAQASGRSSATNSGRGPQPDRIAKIRMQFKAFLSEATGFYHDLILKIRAKHGLPLGHFSDDWENQAIVGTDTAKSSDVKKSCHRCLIYLGDLARYKGLYGEGESRAREYPAAKSYYMQAASLWPSNGNPHHQLAILATYSSDELMAVYRYFRSLAAEIPFSTAKDNLVIAFEKNRQSHTQLLEKMKTAGQSEVSMKQKYKLFCTKFVRLHGILFSRTSLETFPGVLSSVSGALRELLSSGPEEERSFGMDSMENGHAILRIIATLIFTVQNVNKKNEGQTYADILQHTVLFENACTATFELMSLIVERCQQLRDPSSSFLLPGILVFLEWLACSPDVTACGSDEKKQPTSAKLSFLKHCIALFNKVLSSKLVSVDDCGDESCFTNMSRYEEGETDSRLALWEDFELRGFLPLLPAHSILDFSRKHSTGGGGSNREKRTRNTRIIAAGKALTSVAMIDRQSVTFDSKVKQFIIGNYPQVYESPSTEQEIATSSVNTMVMRENIQVLFEGDDEDEEIVFKPVLVEKQIDVPFVTSTHQQLVKSEHIPPSDNAAQQHHPAIDIPNSTRAVEQQALLADGIKKLRFVENGHVLTSGIQDVSVAPDGGSLSLPQPSANFMNNAIYFDYRRTPSPSLVIPTTVDSVTYSEVTSNHVSAMPPPLSSMTFKSQAGRPVRHLGPPPGFRPVPPARPNNVQVPNQVGANGSLSTDDYRWLDGYQMSPSTSSIGLPSHIGNQVSLGNMQFMSNINTSIGGSAALPFPGMQASSAQFQGGSFKSNQDYQSFRNPNPNQQHNRGQPWTGHYRV